MQRATEWRGVVVCSHNEAGPRATRALTMYRALARLAQHLPEHHAGGVGEHLQLHAGAVRAQIPRSLRHAAARLYSATEGGACVPASTQGPGGAEGDRTAQWLRRSEPSQSRVSAAHESHAGRISQAKLREFGPSVTGRPVCVRRTATFATFFANNNALQFAAGSGYRVDPVPCRGTADEAPA